MGFFLPEVANLNSDILFSCTIAFYLMTAYYRYSYKYEYPK